MKVNKIGLLAGLAVMALTGVPAVVYEEPGWCVWCPSPVALPDGRFALVHSRWEAKHGFEAWCAKSEVGLAISEKGALGPYRFVKTILPGSGRDADFDRDVTHNPQVLIEGGKYYLFYMGTRSDVAEGQSGSSSEGTEKGSFRMNQRIGVAVADRIEGPYVRTGKSILPETKERIMASHIAYGSIRMEPVFFALGQVAGTAAVLALSGGASVQDIGYDRLCDRLVQEGQVLSIEESVFP